MDQNSNTTGWDLEDSSSTVPAQPSLNPGWDFDESSSSVSAQPSLNPGWDFDESSSTVPAQSSLNPGWGDEEVEAESSPDLGWNHDYSLKPSKQPKARSAALKNNSGWGNEDLAVEGEKEGKGEGEDTTKYGWDYDYSTEAAKWKQSNSSDGNGRNRGMGKGKGKRITATLGGPSITDRNAAYNAPAGWANEEVVSSGWADELTNPEDSIQTTEEEPVISMEEILEEERFNLENWNFKSKRWTLGSKFSATLLETSIELARVEELEKTINEAVLKSEKKFNPSSSSSSTSSNNTLLYTGYGSNRNEGGRNGGGGSSTYKGSNENRPERIVPSLITVVKKQSPDEVQARISNLSYCTTAVNLEKHLGSLLGSKTITSCVLNRNTFRKPTGSAIVTFPNRETYNKLLQVEKDAGEKGLFLDGELMIIAESTTKNLEKKVTLEESRANRMNNVNSRGGPTGGNSFPLLSLQLISHSSMPAEEGPLIISTFQSNVSFLVEGRFHELKFQFKEREKWFRVSYFMIYIISIKVYPSPISNSTSLIELSFDKHPMCFMEDEEREATLLDYNSSSNFNTQAGRGGRGSGRGRGRGGNSFTLKKANGTTQSKARVPSNGKGYYSRCTDPTGDLNAFGKCLILRGEIDNDWLEGAISALENFGLIVDRDDDFIPFPGRVPPAREWELWGNAYNDVFASSHPFSVRFMISALQSKNRLQLDSRSAIELDELLSDNPEARNLLALERLFARIWKEDPIRLLREDLIELKHKENLDSFKPVREKGIFIRRVFITPLRIVAFPPEWDSANRIIRNYAAFSSRFLRVTFADENFATVMQAKSDNCFDRIDSIVMNGFTIAGQSFVFLAYSSSQLREAGCWFYNESRERLEGELTGAPTAEDIVASMGDLTSIKVAGKYAARVGQGFSSSISTVTIKEEELKRIPDVEWNGYVFSDGVGLISQSLADKVAEYLEGEDGDILKKTLVPSAFQIRYLGVKGVVAVAPKGILPYKINLAIRPSMEKFDGNKEHDKFEVLAYSKVIKTCLNQQVISILSSLGTPDSVFLDLLDSMLVDLDSALEKNAAAIKLLLCSSDQSSSKLLQMLNSGFNVKTDRFLFNLTRAVRSKYILDLEMKARIFVPKAVSLIGILDESKAKMEEGHEFTQPDGLIPEGHIFFQWREGDKLKRLKVGTRVLVYRSPTIHPGDVRVMEVCYFEQLKHLIDVAVFSTKGHRPASNEMSGGDFDGDQYTIIYDKLLVYPQQYAAMSYAPPKLQPRRETIDADSVKEFFVEYLRMNNLGILSNAHKAWADIEREGVKSENCIKLAELCSVAVDYNKTGVPAIMPQELVVTKFPRFFCKGPHKSYKSEKVLDQIWERVTKVSEEGLKVDEPPLILDDEMEVPGFHHYLEEARVLLEEYSMSLWHLMSKYDIEEEGEVISGFCTQFSKKKSRIRGDDASGRLSHEVKALQGKYEGLFYEGLGVGEGLVGHFDRLEGEVRTQALQKASAWYKVTYYQEEIYFDSSQGWKGPKKKTQYLSFPWVVSSILCYIKRKKMKGVEVI